MVASVPEGRWGDENFLWLRSIYSAERIPYEYPRYDEPLPFTVHIIGMF